MTPDVMLGLLSLQGKGRQFCFTHLRSHHIGQIQRGKHMHTCVHGVSTKSSPPRLVDLCNCQVTTAFTDSKRLYINKQRHEGI